MYFICLYLNVHTLHKSIKKEKKHKQCRRYKMRNNIAYVPSTTDLIKWLKIRKNSIKSFPSFEFVLWLYRNNYILFIVVAYPPQATCHIWSDTIKHSSYCNTHLKIRKLNYKILVFLYRNVAFYTMCFAIHFICIMYTTMRFRNSNCSVCVCQTSRLSYCTSLAPSYVYVLEL